MVNLVDTAADDFDGLGEGLQRFTHRQDLLGRD